MVYLTKVVVLDPLNTTVYDFFPDISLLASYDEICVQTFALINFQHSVFLAKQVTNRCSCELSGPQIR